MKGNSGYIVEFENKDGSNQKGVVRYADQNADFRQLGKVLVILCEDNLNYKRDKDNKIRTTLKNVNSITRIGFVD